MKIGGTHFGGGLWNSCETLHVSRSYGNCLHQKVDPSWEVRLVGIELHTGCKGISGYCYHCWILGAIFMGCVDACLKKKKGIVLGKAGAVYLPSESNKVEVWRWWSGLLVNCCVWVLIVGSVCVEICRICSLGKRSQVWRQLWQKFDSQGASMEAEWVTFHG